MTTTMLANFQADDEGNGQEATDQHAQNKERDIVRINPALTIASPGASFYSLPSNLEPTLMTIVPPPIETSK